MAVNRELKECSPEFIKGHLHYPLEISLKFQNNKVGKLAQMPTALLCLKPYESKDQ